MNESSNTETVHLKNLQGPQHAFILNPFPWGQAAAKLPLSTGLSVCGCGWGGSEFILFPRPP